MADVTLAEFNGAVWLVGGEDFIDDLLANLLPPEVTIEIIPCEAKSDVHALWVQHCGQPVSAGDPWLIHPKIADRIRRISPELAVFFGQWSANLDADALAVIAAAARRAADNPDHAVVLADYRDPGASRMLTDLALLRLGLIEEKLLEAGLAAGRVTRESRPTGGLPEESQKIDIIIAPPAGAGS